MPELALGIIAGLSLIYALRHFARCEYCDGQLKFSLIKKPYCKKCGRAPSETDVHI